MANDIMKKSFEYLKWIVAFLLIVTVGCWLKGYTCSWLVVILGLGGLWAVNKFSKAWQLENKARDLYWYLAIFVCVSGTFLIIANNTALTMYFDWETIGARGLVGFFRIYVPLIVLVIGSIALSLYSKSRKFTTALIIVCCIIGTFGLIFYGNIASLDYVVSLKRLKLRAITDAIAAQDERKIGLYACVFEKEIFLYKMVEIKSVVKILKTNEIVGQGTILEVADEQCRKSVDKNGRTVAARNYKAELFRKVKYKDDNWYVRLDEVEIVTGSDVHDNYVIIHNKDENKIVIYSFKDTSITILKNRDRDVTFYSTSQDGSVPMLPTSAGYLPLRDGVVIKARPGKPLQISVSKGMKVEAIF